MIDEILVNQALILDLERVEREAWADFYRASPGLATAECGVVVEEGDFGCCAIASKIDVLALNRVIGFGIDNPTSMRAVEEVMGRYHMADVPRFFVQPCPIALDAGVANDLTRCGFELYNNWVKLYRAIEPVPTANTSLEIREIGPDDSLAFGRIVAGAFDWPEAAAAWVGGTVGRDNWHHFMAFDGEQPVATGAFFKSGEFAWIDFAATLNDYRGRGAQSALLQRRVEVAHESGCKWLVVETAEERPDHPAPSFRNMVRNGFKIAYIRPNYLWKEDE